MHLLTNGGFSYIPVATPAEIAAVGSAYPDDPSLVVKSSDRKESLLTTTLQGSPFNTGNAYTLS